MEVATQTKPKDATQWRTRTLAAKLGVSASMVQRVWKANGLQPHRVKTVRRIDAQTPPGIDLHLTLDNYSTHKHTKVRSWQARHPRRHFHIIPASSSWVNLIERFFGELTRKRIRRGTFNFVAQLEEAIGDYVAQHNADPKPLVWTARTQQILEQIGRACIALNQAASA